MKRNRILWTAVIIALVINYIFSDDYTGLYLLLVIPLILFVSAGYTFVVNRLSRVIITVPETCRKNENITGTIQIISGNGFPVFKLRVKLLIKNLMTGETKEMMFFHHISGKHSEPLEFTLSSMMCGRMEISLASMEIFDLMGVYKRNIKMLSEAAVTVFPETFKMKPEIRSGALADNDSIEYSEVTPGYDVSEVFGIREYREGDSIKNIHWKLTSKCEDIIVKVPSLPMENSILLVLERIIDKGAGYGYKVLDSLAEIFITLSQTLIHDGVKHDIAWYDCRRGQVMTYSIEREDDLFGVMGKLLGAECKEEENKTLRRYVDENRIIDKAHLVYIAPDITADMKMSADEIHKTTIICSDRITGDNEISDANSVVFASTPDNYKQQLHSIDI